MFEPMIMTGSSSYVFKMWYIFVPGITVYNTCVIPAAEAAIKILDCNSKQRSPVIGKANVFVNAHLLYKVQRTTILIGHLSEIVLVWLNLLIKVVSKIKAMLIESIGIRFG